MLPTTRGEAHRTSQTYLPGFTCRSSSEFVLVVAMQNEGHLITLRLPPLL